VLEARVRTADQCLCFVDGFIGPLIYSVITLF